MQVFRKARRPNLLDNKKTSGLFVQKAPAPASARGERGLARTTKGVSGLHLFGSLVTLGKGSQRAGVLLDVEQ